MTANDPDPSSSLHTKLQTILYSEENGPIVKDEEVEEAIAQIKQAFQEAGYIDASKLLQVSGLLARQAQELLKMSETCYIQAHSLPKGIYNATGHSLTQITAEDTMTGPEWLSRFKAELGIQEENPGINNESRTLDTFLSASIDGVEVIEAARRAAGLAGVSDE